MTMAEPTKGPQTKPDPKAGGSPDPKAADAAEAGEGTPAGASAAPKTAWRARIDHSRKFADAIGILSQGMISTDQPTRRMSAIFFASCILLVLVLMGGGLWLKNQANIRGSDEQARNIQGFLEKRIESADAAAATVELGAFTVDLKAHDQGKRPAGVVNLAEIGMTLICDGRAACEYLRVNLERARDQVTPVFVLTDRAELMSIEGKRRLKQAIIKRLNHILPEGKVVEVYFTKLLIS